MDGTVYDLIILGGGCAGLSAGVYAGRARLKTLILEKQKPGGQAANTAEVENYPGIRKTQGPALTADMLSHAMDFGVEYRLAEIIGTELSGDIKTVFTTAGDFRAHAVIIATGANPRRVGFQGEDTYTGRGVAYCATCDGEFFSGLDIFVIGGGYAAADEAVYLTRFGKSVTVVMVTEDFTCAKMVADKVKNHPKIKVVYNTALTEVSGDTLLRRAVFRNLKTGEESVYEPVGENATFGIFIFWGYEPATELFRGKVELDDGGYILTDDSMRTNIPGVFAAGDLRPKLLRQIVTAVADGAVAATSAEKYVTELKERLGLPMFQDDSPSPAAEDTSPLPHRSEPAPAAGSFFDAALAAQLNDIFGKLTKNITLLALDDPSDPRSAELGAFLQETAALSSRIRLERLRAGVNPQRQAALGLERSPVFVLLDEHGESARVKFSGIPGGHEMNSFVLALYHLGASNPLTPAQEGLLARIKRPVHLQVAVSLSCHYCPDVVAAAHAAAIASPFVSAEMIDIALFPEIRDRYRIMSVPALIIDGGQKLLFGSKTMDEILEAVAEVSSGEG